jgi:tetratricopeptide (TPR) repeat protein
MLNLLSFYIVKQNALVKSAQRCLTVGLVCVISACTTTPQLVQVPVPPSPTVVVIEKTPEPIRPTAEYIPSEPVNKTIVPQSPTSIVQEKQSDAVIALLNSAEQSQEQGDYQTAQNILQRAQRIAPRDPEVYYQLAISHRDLEDYKLAEHVALKGVSIVQGQSQQLRRFWLLIANINTLAGNDEAAKKAQQTADRY